jgi:hypothetical protein
MDPSSPYYFTPTVSGGTKRTRSEFEELPPDVINPLSHRPGTLQEFRAAGHSELLQVPRRIWAKFPHKDFKEPDVEPDVVPDDEGQDDYETEDEALEDGGSGPAIGAGKPTTSRSEVSKVRGPSEIEKVYAEAREAITIWLQQGHIRKAKKLMALFVHPSAIALSSTRNDNVDLRKNGLWGLMTEILMRDGEDDDENNSNDTKDPSEPPRWGSAKNMPQVREFLSSLIVKHPYNHNFPHRISALHFWPALLNTEVYNVHAEQIIALHRLERRAREQQQEEAEDDEEEHRALLGLDDDVLGMSDGGSRAGSEGYDEFRGMARDMEAQHKARETDRVRIEALQQIRDVLAQVDALMENNPYKTDREMLNLYGMTLLYYADLQVPASEEAKGESIREHDNIMVKAKGVLLGQLVRVGGSVTYELQSFLTDKVAGEVDIQDDDGI